MGGRVAHLRGMWAGVWVLVGDESPSYRTGQATPHLDNHRSASPGGRRLAEIERDLVDFGAKVACFSRQKVVNVGPGVVELGPTWIDFGSSLAGSLPNLVAVGRPHANFGDDFGQSLWSDQVWSNSGPLWSNVADFGPALADLTTSGRFRAKVPDVGRSCPPKLGQF